jgi:hypothetical protein
MDRARYSLSDGPGVKRGQKPRNADDLDFAIYSDLVRDIMPRSHELPPGTHPFPTKFARRSSSLTFNVAGYSRQIVNDFLVEGGKLEHAEFREPSELTQLPQKVIINATGYGARSLWKDESIVPVRGQIGWLISQPGVNYGVIYNGIAVLARRDGIVVQAGLSDMEGYNDANETPDRPFAETTVQKAAELFRHMKTSG